MKRRLGKLRIFISSKQQLLDGEIIIGWKNRYVWVDWFILVLREWGGLNFKSTEVMTNEVQTPPIILHDNNV